MSLDFPQQVQVTLLDKGLLALVVALAVWRLNVTLEMFKAKLSRRAEFERGRLEAVRTLNRGLRDLSARSNLVGIDPDSGRLLSTGEHDSFKQSVEVVAMATIDAAVFLPEDVGRTVEDVLRAARAYDQWYYVWTLRQQRVDVEDAAEAGSHVDALRGAARAALLAVLNEVRTDLPLR